MIINLIYALFVATYVKRVVQTIYLFDKKWKTLKLSRESLPAKVATRNKSKKQNPEEGGVFENGAFAFSKRYFLKLVFFGYWSLKMVSVSAE